MRSVNRAIVAATISILAIACTRLNSQPRHDGVGTGGAVSMGGGEPTERATGGASTSTGGRTQGSGGTTTPTAATGGVAAGSGGAGTITGGTAATGGVVGVGGGGSGDRVGAAGTTSGGSAVGGAVAVGVAGGGGVGGAGGTIQGCRVGTTQCSPNGLQTCGLDGYWGVAVPCGVRQTCTEGAGIARCTCTIDPVCRSIGTSCSDHTTVVECMQDIQACYYQASASTCVDGACIGASGSSICCYNGCVLGATECLSDTSLRACTSTPDGCSMWSGVDCATGTVCERYTPPSCVDPNWAQWPMPNGQGDVSNGAPTPVAYTASTDGTILDNTTQLLWQQTAPITTYSSADAVSYCSTLNLGGHSDWRLPSVIELVSILVWERANPGPAVDPVAFPNTPALHFWSSTSVAGIASNRWAVDFGYGNIAQRTMTTLLNIRCVR